METHTSCLPQDSPTRAILIKCWQTPRLPKGNGRGGLFLDTIHRLMQAAKQQRPAPSVLSRPSVDMQWPSSITFSLRFCPLARYTPCPSERISFQRSQPPESLASLRHLA